MNVETPQTITSERQGDLLQSTITRSPSVDAVSNTGADVSAATADDDDMIEVAYHEIRRSVSPQVAQYIFQSGEDDLSTKDNLAGARWTIDRILSIPITDSELRKISEESLRTLYDLGYNLWSFTKQRYLNCCAHIMEVFLAKIILDGSGIGMFETWASKLALTYLKMNRIAECETLLTNAIAGMDSLRLGDQRCNELRSSLAIVYLQRGQHTLAEESCTQAFISLKSTLGLCHLMTWSAFYRLHYILAFQGRFDDSWHLMMEFYIGIYQVVSPQVLPGLISLLELCERYIDEWMAESELQRLLRDRFIGNISLSISDRIALTLITILRKRGMAEFDLGTLPQIVRDLAHMTGLHMQNFFTNLALLIAPRIQATRHLESILLQQEALRAVRNLRSTNFLVPLFVFHFLNGPSLWKNGSSWRKVEQNLIHSLQNVANENECPPDGLHLQLSDYAGHPKSTSVMAHSHAIPLFDPPNRPDRSISATTASGQAPSAEMSSHTVGFNNGTAMPIAVSSATFFWPIPQLSSVYNKSPVSANDGHIELVNTPSRRAQNAEPYPLQPRSPGRGVQLSSEDQSNNGFSATMMDAATPPFTWSLPRTPQASHIFPPPGLARDSPAPVPSSVLAGYLDFSGSSNLFGLPQLPIPPSPSFGSSSSPKS